MESTTAAPALLDLEAMLCKEAGKDSHPTPPPAYSPPIRLDTLPAASSSAPSSSSCSPSSPSSSPSPLVAATTGPPCHPMLINRSSLASLLPAGSHQHQHQHQHQQTPDEALYADDAPPPSQSGISLRINTSVRVSSNNNHVCVSETPAEHASAIARAVVHAIQENSSGQCGIPMIDEDGRPRPVSVHVDAVLEVHGEGNVVGNDGFVTELLRRRRRRDEDRRLSPGRSVKRRRSQ
ncbi:hypothetical protein E4U41_001348 [Claviceps citrina]|nr:hypothetical protein E4U41_001348 [Claviceps citrina]